KFAPPKTEIPRQSYQAVALETRDSDRLLRPRRERPRGGCAAEQRDELAAFQLSELHSIPASQDRLQDIELAGVRVGEIVLRMATTCRVPRTELGASGPRSRRQHAPRLAATRITPAHSGETTSPTVSCNASM